MKVRITSVPKRRMKISGGPKMQNGGLPVVQGLPESQEHTANVEAEAGEVYEDNTGDLKKISDNEKSHEQGGVMLNDVSRVLEDTSTSRKDRDSKKLAISPEDAELITGFRPKGKTSHSKLLEQANDHFTNRIKKVEGSLKKSLAVLDKNPNDMFAKNSMNLNLSQLQNIPSKGELFDNLFEHQEGVKALHKIGDEYKKAKFGFYYPPKPKTAEFNQKKIYMQKYGGKGKKMQTGGDTLQDYAGAQTTQGRYTPTGVDVNLVKDYVPLQDYKTKWKGVGLDLSSAKSIKDAQGQTYDYLLDKAPDALRAMWSHYGNTAQGMQSGILTKKYPKGVFSNPDELTIEDLKKLKSAYTDEKLGPRRLLPGSDTTPDKIEGTVPPNPASTPPAPVRQPYGTPTRNYSVTGNPKSEFNEPLNWYDVAGPIGAYMSAINRRGVPYNPMEFHQLHYQLQNPLPALQSGQTDYNAALANLATKGQGSGVANANVATLFGKKYQLNNEILGSYENINKNIKNQEITYNTQVRDKQSAADQAARDVQEQRIAAGMEAQRLQKLTSLDDLYTRIAQNRRFNTEGNLIMKLAPAFDQNADYNGYKYLFRAPMSTPQQPAPTMKTTTTKGKTTNYVVINGVKYPIGQ